MAEQCPLKPGHANGIIMGMITNPNGPVKVEHRMDISVGGIPVATAVSERTFSNVENGKLRSHTPPGGGMTNNYTFTTTPIRITQIWRGPIMK
jgi:hypothetical protein